jgi:hypothetical protein
MKKQQTNKKNKSKILPKCENLNEKRVLFTALDSAQHSKTARGLPSLTRMGSRPNSQRLGRRGGPATPPAWAESSPRGRLRISAVDLQIDV